ncbi:MAG TPA: triose-phosphate isomerase [Candidatus Cloacimonadota bacterium]|nr:triose-phosphate isomerase [Candidatus Cloacimonadota bacterium]HOV17181.1 triose-phosphate isomerase [Candidatus Cloacimonadota bacterium]HQL15452.1 triose-phosphate isomerase [Candidatus Cloacimonadota bacterium]
MRPLLIAGNWKMNKDLFETLAFLQGLRAYAQKHKEERVQIVVAPAYPFLLTAVDLLKDTPVKVAAQDVSSNEDGAFTGEVSASMLASLHLSFCIVGHSECRQYHSDTDDVINIKLQRVIKNGMKPIFCIGEKLEERQSGRTNEVLQRQLAIGLNEINLSAGKDLVIAYEPVWAIGTGQVATPQQAQEAQAFIRNFLLQKYGAEVADTVQILYGGSVKPDNIKEIILQPDIDGALIGGASLKLDLFTAMIDLAKEAVKIK